MPTAYVDTSLLIAIAFGEEDADAALRKLNEYDRLLSSNLLEAELRSSFYREGIEYSPDLTSGISWILPDRPVTAELAAVLEKGYLRGADLMHVATALYAVGGTSPDDASELTFLTLDSRQRAAAVALGFRT